MKKILTILLCVACLCANAQNNGKVAPKKALPKKAAPAVKPPVVKPPEMKDEEVIDKYKFLFLGHLPVIIPATVDKVVVNFGSEGGYFTLGVTNNSIFDVQCALIDISYYTTDGYPVEFENYRFENIPAGTSKTKKINFEKGKKVTAISKGYQIDEIDLNTCK